MKQFIVLTYERIYTDPLPIKRIQPISLVDLYKLCALSSFFLGFLWAY